MTKEITYWQLYDNVSYEQNALQFAFREINL